LSAYDEYRHHLPDGLWQRYAADIANVAGRAATGTLILAEQAGDRLGAVTFVPGPSDATSASLRLLGVLPEARGKGIAQALMAECVRRAQALGRTHLELHTTPFMTAARRLYLHLGFQPVPEGNMQIGPLTLEAFKLDLHPGVPMKHRP
jgi:GNAT superfamily N-acetyltransferase